MGLKDWTKEDLQEIPMVDVAYEVMKNEGKPFNYYDLFERVAEIKELTKEERELRISKLYTDINIDGRFHSLGDNQWGLKSWYPLEQTEEEITTPVKRKKKKSIDEDDDDLLLDEYEDDDFDELDEEDEEYDDEDVLDDDDDLEDEDEDLDEDDLEYDKDELDDLDDDVLVEDDFEEEEID